MNISLQDQTASGAVPVQVSNLDTIVNTPQKQPKSAIQHKDKLGRIIVLDDFVAFANHNHLNLGKIIKLNNKMVKIQEIKSKSIFGPKDYNKYPHDVVKLEQSDMTWFILKTSA